MTAISVPPWVVQSIYNDEYDLVTIIPIYLGSTMLPRDYNFSGHERNVTGVFDKYILVYYIFSSRALVVVVVISRLPHRQAPDLFNNPRRRMTSDKIFAGEKKSFLYYNFFRMPRRLR